MQPFLFNAVVSCSFNLIVDGLKFLFFFIVGNFPLIVDFWFKNIVKLERARQQRGVIIHNNPLYQLQLHKKVIKAASQSAKRNPTKI